MVTEDYRPVKANEGRKEIQRGSREKRSKHDSVLELAIANFQSHFSFSISFFCIIFFKRKNIKFLFFLCREIYVNKLFTTYTSNT